MAELIEVGVVIALIASSFNVILNLTLLSKFPTIMSIRNLLVGIAEHLGITYDAQGRMIIPKDFANMFGMGKEPYSDKRITSLEKEAVRLRTALNRKQKKIDELTFEDGGDEDEDEDYDEPELYNENNVDWNLIESVKNTIGLGHINFQDPAMKQTAIQVLNEKPDIAKAYEQAKQMGGSGITGMPLTSSGLPANEVNPHSL